MAVLLLRARVAEAAQAGFKETVGCGLPCVPDERKNSNINTLRTGDADLRF